MDPSPEKLIHELFGDLLELRVGYPRASAEQEIWAQMLSFPHAVLDHERLQRLADAQHNGTLDKLSDSAVWMPGMPDSPATPA